MEICKWHIIYVVLSCVLIPYLAAKPVSLNDIIAAESKQKQGASSTQRPTDTSERISLNKILKLKPNIKRKSKNGKTSDLMVKPVSLNDIIAAESKLRQQVKSTQRTLPDTSLERFSLKKLLNLKPRLPKKLKIPESILPRKKTSLIFRNRFQTKSPLKPRRLKFVQKPRHKRRNPSIKREIYENEKLNRKYIPLLRSISELFDNMLPSDSGESSDIERSHIKSRRNKNKDRNESSCTCNPKSKVANTKSSEETTSPTTTDNKGSTFTENPVTPTEITTTTPPNVIFSDISDLRSNTDVPILLTRDPLSSGRDDSRLGEGNSPSLYKSTEGNIARDNGNSERNTAHGEDRSSSTDYEANPDSDTRNVASGSRFEGGRGLHRVRDDTRRPVYRGEAQETNENLKNKDAIRHFRGDVAKFERETELEMGRDKAESSTHIPHFVPGFKGFVPMGEIRHSTQFLQPKETYEKSVINISDDISSNKRIVNRDGTYTTDNQKAGQTNATVISIKDLSNPIIMLQSPKPNAPYVTIIDGYSVARDINGSNKLAKQSL